MKKIEVIIKVSIPIVYYTKDNNVLAGTNTIVMKPIKIKLNIIDEKRKDRS